MNRKINITPMDVTELGVWIAEHPHARPYTMAADLFLRRLQNNFHFAKDVIVRIIAVGDTHIQIDTSNATHCYEDAGTVLDENDWKDYETYLAEQERQEWA